MILLDTSVLIELGELSEIPGRVALSSLSHAELLLGVEVANDSAVHAVRQEKLRWLESLGLDWLPFDSDAARGYAAVAAEVWKTRRAHARTKDIMLAGHAYALGAHLATLNPKDFELVSDMVPIIVPKFA
jgi:predicted nucleic acid-binding protein